MTKPETVTLFHAPQTRSAGTLTLLEELGAPYELSILNLKINEQRSPEYLAINPLGKVPAIRHRGRIITEQVAIFIYLADAFPEAQLAPGLDDPDRGAYLRWLVFYAACFEPALTDRALERDPGRRSSSPYGDYDAVIAAIENQLRPGPYLLGARLSAADILWGTALGWTMGFGLVPRSDTFNDYSARIAARPAFVKTAAQDAHLAAEQERIAAWK